jgi:hypothetical protein
MRRWSLGLSWPRRFGLSRGRMAFDHRFHEASRMLQIVRLTCEQIIARRVGDPTGNVYFLTVKMRPGHSGAVSTGKR